MMPVVGRRIAISTWNGCAWLAYCSSDSSRQCHGVAKNKVERLSGLAAELRQSYHSVTRSQSHRESPNDPSQHTLHELRARRLSKTHNTVELYSTKSDVKVISSRDRFQNSRSITWLQSHDRYTEQVSEIGTASGMAWRGRAARAQLRRAAYAYPCTINGW